MATRSSIFAWRIAWTEEPGELLSLGLHRIGHNWSDLTCIHTLEKEIATHSSILAWRIPWTEEPGRLLSMGLHGVGHDWSDLTCIHALEKEMATCSSILAWRIPGTEEPGGLPSMGSHRVRHDWSDLAAAAVWNMGWFSLLSMGLWKLSFYYWFLITLHCKVRIYPVKLKFLVFIQIANGNLLYGSRNSNWSSAST